MLPPDIQLGSLLLMAIMFTLLSIILSSQVRRIVEAARAKAAFERSTSERFPSSVSRVGLGDDGSLTDDPQVPLSVLSVSLNAYITMPISSRGTFLARNPSVIDPLSVLPLVFYPYPASLILPNLIFIASHSLRVVILLRAAVRHLTAHPLGSHQSTKGRAGNSLTLGIAM